MIKPTRRICHICGREYESTAAREFFCPDCKPAASRAQKDRRNARRREERRKKAMMAVRIVTPVSETLGQRNKRMRELGLTYGGRPIVSQHIGWPKFLQEAVKKWRKNA